MTMPRELTSSKFRAAIASTVIALAVWATVFFSQAATRIEKDGATSKLIMGLAVVWAAAIGGTAFEDAAEKHKPNDPSLTGDPNVQIPQLGDPYPGLSLASLSGAPSSAGNSWLSNAPKRQAGPTQKSTGAAG